MNSQKTSSGKDYKSNSICPHLGMKDDSQTIISYPSNGNVCFHCSPLNTPEYEYQSQFCLSSNYRSCQIYSSAANEKMPSNILHKGTQGKIIDRYRLYWISGAFLLLLTATLLVWFFQNDSNDQSIVPVTPVPLLSPQSAADPTGTETPSNAIGSQMLTQTPQENSEPTQNGYVTTELEPHPTRFPHYLETQLGKQFKFVIHRVSEGESIPQFANLFNTTPDVIRAVNHNLLIPIWPGSIIVIPVDVSDASEFPAFDVFMIETEGLTVEDIAAMLALDPDPLIFYNDLQAGDMMFLGEWLLIPRQ